MEIKLDFKINLTPPQKELLKEVRTVTNKYILANFSRQQGKTTIIECLMIYYLCKKKYTIAYVSPTLKLSKKVFKEMKTLLDGTGIIKASNATDLSFTSFNGSTLNFYSSEQSDSIRGISNDILIVDEAAFLNEGSDGNNIWWNILFPTVKVKGKKIIMISTPNGKQGFWFDLIQRAIKGEKGYKYIKKTIYDDSLITNDELEVLKKNYPEIAFKQEFLCEFLDDALTALPGFSEKFTDYQFVNKKCWIGVDLSANGEDNTILTYINEDGQTKQFQIKGSLDNKYKQIADLINNCPNLVGGYIEQNGIGEPMLNEIMKLIKPDRRQNIKYWLTTNDSKQDAINMLSLAISNGEIWFHKDNKMLHSEMSTFIYKLSKTKKIIYEAKAGFHDDSVMSVALANMAKNDLKSYGGNNYVFIKGRQSGLTN